MKKSSKLSSTRDNSTSGVKAHHDNRYIKVGRVRMNSWMSTKLPVADILVSERELVHIAAAHAKELQRLGMSSLNYVTSIVNQCSQVRRDTRTQVYIFIIYPDDVATCSTAQTAILELTIAQEKGKRVYKIRTAHPENWERLSRYEIVCVKPRS